MNDSQGDDSTALPPELVITLRSALLQEVLRPAAGDGGLREVLHDLAREARARGLGAQQLLAALQPVLDDVVASTDPGTPEEEQRARESLIARCLEQYSAFSLVLASVVSMLSLAA